MFRMLSIIGFVVTFVGIAVCCVAFPCSKECRWSPVGILRRLVHLFTLLFLEQKLSLVGALRKLVYLLALLCFVVLAVTGFYPLLVLDEHISGYLMMVHATFSPVFAGCLAILAVMWAGRCRFNQDDCPWLQGILRRITRWSIQTRIQDQETGTENQKPIGYCLSVGQKITFWLIIFLALPLILSIVSSMFVFFGTDWQEFLLAVHRYTALVFALVAIVHTYLMIRTKMKE